MFDKIIKSSKKNIDISDTINCLKFSVLIPIIGKEKDLSLLYEVRSENLASQPNEICFPGGRTEPGEANEEAAKRETIEELLLKPENVEILGPSDILITPFNTIIYPYIGIIKSYNGTFNKDEVKEVFTVPISFLLSNEPLCHYIDVSLIPRDDFPYDLIQNGRNYKWGKGKYPVYFYLYEDKIIWGITARITYDFIKNLKNI